METLKYVAVPTIFLVVAVVVAMVFSSMEPVKVESGTYSSKAEAVAASFK